MTGSEVLCEERDGVAIITLNRPARRNALSAELCAMLRACLRQVSESAARVVLLRGAERDFCVGADLDAAPVPEGGGVSSAFEIPVLIHTMPQVTIAAIDGGCAGAGLAWACACDLRFASTRAKFSTAFLKVGASGDMGMAWSLMRAVGATRARELLLFPEKFGAEEALGWDVVTRVFAPEQLFDDAFSAARSLAGAPPLTLRMMKANLLSAEALTMDAYVDVEAARHLHVASGPSLREGFAAFRAAREGDEPR